MVSHAPIFAWCAFGGVYFCRGETPYVIILRARGEYARARPDQGITSQMILYGTACNKLIMSHAHKYVMCAEIEIRLIRDGPVDS